MRTLSIKRRDKDGVAIPLRLGPPVDGAKPFEVYGFAGSIGSLVAFAVYLFWAYLPESWLHALGFTYYPSRYWAMAIPSYAMVMLVFILALYISLNFISTPPPQSLYTLCDEYTTAGQNEVMARTPGNEEFPAIHPHSDISIIAVNAGFEYSSLWKVLSISTMAKSIRQNLGYQGGSSEAVLCYAVPETPYDSDSLLWSTRPPPIFSGAFCVIKENQKLYLEWCTIRIQTSWRCVSQRKLFRSLRRAARKIQTAWRAFVTFQEENARKSRMPTAFLVETNKMYELIPVIKIQRCWRAYLDKLEFEDVRNLIRTYEKTDPKASLLRINRSEATLADKAAGLHVRFRLCGLSFPPMVVYKVYTHRPVVDMGSFSPRQYSERLQTLATTYVRCENNDWRPVIGTPAEQAGPKAILRVPNLEGSFFSNSPDERRVLKLLAVKKRKRAWLKKLYIEGRAAENSKVCADDGVGDTGVSKPELPELELMRWSAGLDFDAYERDWYTRALSIPEEYHKDWHMLGTSLPAYPLPAHPVPHFDTPAAFY